MKSVVFFFVAVFFLFSCGNSSETIYDGEITKVVHLYPDPAKLGDLEDDFLEDEGLISDYVFSGTFKEEDLNSIKVYYTENKEYTDEKASEILRYFEIVPNEKNREETKCITMYRDIFLFYKGDELVACCKVCFSCDKEYFVDIKGDFAEKLTSANQKIMVDIKELEKFLEGK